jgi:MoaA/NifB/PqqE/SkfB family radical SAM enzyme
MQKKMSFTMRAFNKFLNIPTEIPNFAQIEITNICNLDCQMCVRNFIKLGIKHMDFDLFKRIVDKLDGVYTLNLTGYGEPLSHPRIIDAIKYCKSKCFEVQTTTNGLLLDEDRKITDLVSSGLDLIAFSVETVNEVNEIAHQNLKALESIKRLIELKRELNSSTPAVTLQTLMIKGREQDLFDVIEWGALNGVDRINVARFDLNTLTDVERPDVTEEQVIFREFARLRRKYNIRIDCVQDQFYDGLKGFLYKHFKHFLENDKNCTRLNDFTYVSLEGDVRPCCALVNNKIYNLLDSDLRKIWNSEKYNYFRKNHFKFTWCSNCDIFTLRQKSIKE